MTTRGEVFAAINSERDYQDDRWPGHRHEAESWVLFIEHYVDQARAKAATTDFRNADNLTAYLSDLRKIAALAVAAMEEHGAPMRTFHR